MSRDVVGPIGSAINSEEETIVFYKDLLDMFPDFAPVLKDIIAEEEKHIGQLEVLRNSASSEMTKNIEKGVEEAEHQLATGSSEEPDDLGEAEVEVDDIAIEIPEEDTV
jgi:rubrerythrin